MALLSKFTVLQSRDLSELQEMVSSFSSPVRLTLNRKGEEVDANMAIAQIGDVPLMYGTFGEARVDWHSDGECTDTMLMFAPIEGGGEITHRGQSWRLSKETGMMRDLGIEATAYQEKFHSLVMPISKLSLREHARNLGGEQFGLYPIEFNPTADFTTTGGKMIKQYLLYLANALDHGLIDVGNVLLTSQMRDLLLTQILTQMDSSVRDALTGRETALVVPRHVKRAQEYIHAHTGEALDMQTLSEAAGCSYRTLQRGFFDAFGLTPNQYIRKIRLQFVRNDLIGADIGTPIASIARKWGFGHMGRFSQEYAREFGELPTDTVR
ncbi:MAG: AraC family transcriptional regulator [Thalassospira sp.]|uniref:AraC family transcriptional regulator n=1 Tax=Thalassospira sp. TaxID=1912094 RepID=UPI003A87FE89